MDTLLRDVIRSLRNIHPARLIYSNILATLNNLTKDKWDRNYKSCSSDFPSPAEVLVQNQHLLPDSGTALDLACGRGANAICLAENGLAVSAWDIAASALESLSKKAKQQNLTINTETTDITNDSLVTNTFDVIVVSRFLDRALISSIKNAIKTDGLIFYQTFIRDKVDATGPSNPDYLLDKNELLGFFKGWQIHFYREDGITGDTAKGFRNQAMIVAQKPSLPL